MTTSTNIAALLCVIAFVAVSSDTSTFTCTDVEFQSCSRVCSDRIIEGLDVEHGECTDDCEGQTVACETVRMPNPFGAKAEEPRSEGAETDLTVFTCDDVEFQSCSRVCSDRIVDGLDIEHGVCTGDCEDQTVDCVTVRMPNPFGARSEGGGETDPITSTFTCTDVEFQSCSRVCSDRIVEGLDVEHGECTDDCEGQTVDCVTVRMPNPFGARDEPRARKRDEPRARKEEPRARKEEFSGGYGGHYAGADNTNAALEGTVQVSAFWVYAVAALLTVLVTANVTCLVMQRRSNGKKLYESVNYDSSV